MPGPTAGDVHVNRPLTQISIAHMQKAEGFVADQVFPNISVNNQSDLYYKYDRADWSRSQFAVRAPGTESAGSGWKQDKGVYFADVLALHHDIADQIRGNEDSPLDADRDTTMFLSQQALIAREVTWGAKNFVTSVWKGIDGTTGDVTGVSAAPVGNQVRQWSDAVNADPIADIKKYSDAIMLRSAVRPNTLTMGRQVWTQVSEHPDFVDRIKFSSSNSQPAIVSRMAAAQMWELDKVLVMDGIQAISPENPLFETGMNFQFIGGKSALLVYANPTPSIMQPSGGYTFSWGGFTGAGKSTGENGRAKTFGVRMKKFRMEATASDRVEAEMAYDQRAVTTECKE
jgi:hypothetical protein